jgi:hypothetical protein
MQQYLLPLLFLTLKRHLEVFHYARFHVVDEEEFSHMTTSLNSVFEVVKQRIESLRGMCGGEIRSARNSLDATRSNL